jgi:hypothetical protein
VSPHLLQSKEQQIAGGGIWIRFDLDRMRRRDNQVDAAGSYMAQDQMHGIGFQSDAHL